MNTRIVAACAALALGGGATTLAYAPALVQRDGVGFAQAQVYHAVTGEPLGGMPVVVRKLGGPRLTSPSAPRTFVTDENGIAQLGPLAEGEYEAKVVWNRNESDPAYFSVNGNTDSLPVVALFFNPDMDKN